MSDELFHTIRVNREVLVKWIKGTQNKGRYKLGKKLPMGMQLKDWHNPQVDCSGYVRLLINRISLNHTIMPDGSYWQNRWCMEQRFAPCDYSDCRLNDDRLRIVFIAPTRSGHGHVWLVVNGKTIESWGGHGPGRRSWWVKALLPRVSSCYVLTEPMNQQN